MREQVRLWFYSMLFMSVVLEGRAPYERVLSYERVISETGEKFSKTGHMIRFDDAVAEIGADPDPLPLLPAAGRFGSALRLRRGRAGAAPARGVVEHRVVLRHVREHRPRRDGRAQHARRPAAPHRSLAARPHRPADRRRDRGDEARGHADDGARVRGVRRRGVELVRARQPPPLLASGGRPRQGRGALVVVRGVARGDVGAGADRAVRHRSALAAGDPQVLARRRRDARVGAPRALARDARRLARRRAARSDAMPCGPSSAPRCDCAKRRSSASASRCRR